MTDYQPLLARALKGLDRNTSEARRAVYDRARQALLNQLRSAAPPMADADITRERLALEDAIRKTETEAVMAEPHSVRAPSAARMPTPPRAPAPPPPAAARPSPRIPVHPRIPMPPQPHSSVPPPLAAEELERKAEEGGAEAEMPALPPAASAPRGPLPSAHPLRARPARPGNGADASRENREENAPEARASGLPPPELLEELKAELEPLHSPLPPPAQRFERPRPPQRPRGQAPGGDFPPPPPPGARPRPPRAPGQRPPGPGMPPGAARAKPPKPAGNNLWKIVLASFAVLLIVAAGVLAFTMRGRISSGSAPQSSVADTDAPKTSERIAQSEDGQGRTSAPSNLDPAVAQRAVLYEENPGGGQQFQNFVGTAVWRTEAVNAPGRAPDLGLRIEIEIPERKVNVTLKMRRNTDPSFPASHTIEVIFNVPAGDAFGGVADMRGIRAKGGETAQGSPIIAEVQKVKEGYFLLALPNMQEETNLSMLRERDWLDLPFVYANGRRAVLTFQKGTPGERALREVLNSWGQGQGQNQTGSQ